MKKWEAPLSANAVDTVRWRWFDGQPYPFISATSVLGLIIPDGLKKWFVDTDGGTVRRISKASADKGTRVHAIVEALSKGQQVTVEPEYAGIISEYRQFLTTERPEFLHVERVLHHDRYAYSGMADAIVRIGDKVELWDYKTGRVTTQTGWQLGAYVLAARSIGIPVDGMRAIQLNYRLNKIEVFKYEHIDFCIIKFLQALDIFRGQYFNNLLRGIDVPGTPEKAKFPIELLTFNTSYDYIANLKKEENKKEEQ